MPAGILVINSSGTTLIDENYSNLAVRASGTITGTTTNTGKLSFTVPTGLNSPLMAIAPSAQPFSVTGYSAATGSMRLAGRPLTQSTNFPYYLFDTPIASAVNSGLKIYNASGVLVFDSNLKYARVVDIFGGSTVASWAGDRTYTAGRTYAVVELTRAFVRTTTNMGGGTYEKLYQRSTVKVVSNVVTTALTNMGTKTDGVNSPNYSNTNAQFAVLDVTGY